jgi:hypothetical protein
MNTRPLWLRLFFVVHDDGGLELRLEQFLILLLLVVGGYWTHKLLSGAWAPGVVVTVAFFSGIFALAATFYLGAIPIDKARVVGGSRLPADIARAIASSIPDTPEDRETMARRSDD